MTDEPKDAKPKDVRPNDAWCIEHPDYPDCIHTVKINPVTFQQRDYLKCPTEAQTQELRRKIRETPSIMESESGAEGVKSDAKDK